MIKLFTLCYEYLTQNTINELFNVAKRQTNKSIRYPMMLSLLLKEFRKNETEIITLFCSLVHQDELIQFMDLAEVQKFSETSQIQIFAHLFFVDSFERYSEINSTVFFVGICAGINS
jgi:hypothetical protein